MAIVLSFVAQVRLELRMVTQIQERHLARSNAKLGAELALARLQETAGPDTRVTLPASADASVTALATNRMWTGVRDSAPHQMGTDGRLELNPDYNAHLGWLVSSPSGTVPEPDASVFTSDFQPAAGHALLVGRGSVVEADDAVAAPSVSIRNKRGEQQGGYAFWVGDEASKSQINLSDPFRDDSNPDNDIYRAMTVQRSGSEVFLDGFDPDDPDHGELLARTVMAEQLDLLGLSSRDMRETFHELTLSSYGLPTNVKRGGLKRDLTPVLEETLDNGGSVGGDEYDALLAFQEARIARLREETEALPTGNPGFPEHVWNNLNAITLREDQASPDNKVLMYPPFSDMHLGYDAGGPHWSQLLTWATYPERAGSSSRIDANKMRSSEFGAVPVMARYNLGVYWTMDWPRLKLHFVPTIILWNPYDRPINARDYYVSLQYGPQHHAGYKVHFRVRNPNWQGGDSFWTPQYKVQYRSWKYGVHMTLKLEAEEIPAGAAIVYSMRNHEEMVLNGSGYVDRNDYATLSPGLHGGGGFSFYIEDPDINAAIIDESNTYKKTYTSAWNSWDRAGLPLFFEDPDNPGNADPDHDGWNLVTFPERNLALNVNGLDPAQGWEIVETATTFTRSTGVGDTKLLSPSFDFYHEPPRFNGFPNAFSTRESNQPWWYLRNVHASVPETLHRSNVSAGIFPSMPGPLPSFPGSGSPFRSDVHDSYPFWGFSWWLRLPDTSFEYNVEDHGAGANLNASIAWLAHYNPTATYQVRSPADTKHYFGSTQAYNNIPTYIGGFTFDPDYFNMSNFSDDDKHMFIGHSDGVPGGFAPGDIPRAILYQFPDNLEELTSPAALSAAPLQAYGGPTTYDASGTIGSRIVRKGVAGGNLQPSYPIGNSLVSPLVASDLAVQTYFPSAAGPASPPLPIPYTDGAWGHDESVPRGTPKPYVVFRAMYDMSWVLNEMMWDDFFFTPDSNSRLRWVDGLVGRGFDTSAQNLAVEGVFNVNSTSVEAWRSLLRGMLDVEIDNRTGEAELAGGVERLPFARSVRPFGSAYSPESGDTFDSMSNFTGYRRLTLDKVDALANEIATQVAERGPFLSMADFVNRRLLDGGSDPGDHRLKGALQDAIDNSGLNDSQEDGSDPTSSLRSGEFIGEYRGGNHFFALNEDALTGATNKGAPGYFLQGDLLARIGSVLQVRSDTFKIRAYGESGEAGVPGARVWCELVVRRNPDYVEPTDPAELHPDDALPINQFFGRRFEIINFRWLSEEDV